MSSAEIQDVWFVDRLAPECLTAYSFTSSSDVWAFAVTLWEMFAGGAVPWSGLSADDVSIFHSLSCLSNIPSSSSVR